MSSLKFKPNDKVFAKMKGWAHWPAKIDGIANQTPKKVKYHIYFYGTRQTALCKEEDLYPYFEYKEKYGKLKKNEEFNKAMREVEEDNELDNVATPRNALNVTSEIDTYQDDLVLTILETERSLLEVQYSVECSLTRKKANVNATLKCLDDLIELKLNTLVIKKNPSVIDFLINKLQSYVGNVEEWNMTEEEVEDFQDKAASIRLKASEAFHKIQSLFCVPHGVKFSDIFADELRKFKSATQNMSEEELFLLVKDPSAEV